MPFKEVVLSCKERFFTNTGLMEGACWDGAAEWVSNPLDFQKWTLSSLPHSWEKTGMLLMLRRSNRFVRFCVPFHGGGHVHWRIDVRSLAW